jgi:hypothetical protein
MTQRSPGRRRWRSIGIFLLHSTCATAGVLIITFALTSLGMTLFPQPAGPVINTPLANFHPGPPATFVQKVTNAPLDPPFLGEMVIALVLGLALNRWLESKSAKWAWILPLAWLVFLIIGERPRNPLEGTFFHATWNNFFSMDPGEEGLAAMFGTAPFYSSIAYSIGAWLALKAQRREVRPE